MAQRLTLLLDADVLRYLLAFQNTKHIQFDPEDEVSEVTNPDKARVDLEDYVEELMGRFKADDFLLPLSGSGNFRKDVWPTYKANRNHKARPSLWYEVDGFLRDLWADKIIEREGLEGDDIIGLLATNPKARRAPGKKLVVSIDKDMRTLPGTRLYNPNKPSEGVRSVSHHDADLYWMSQVLTGDQTDNYPGLPGTGPKKTDALLLPIHEQFREAAPEEHLQALWSSVVSAYEDNGMTADDALVQARCARILRHGDYNFKTEEVKLWTPA